MHITREVLARTKTGALDIGFEPRGRIFGRSALEGEKPAFGNQERRGALHTAGQGVAQPDADRSERAPVAVVRRAVHDVDPALQGAADDRSDARIDLRRGGPGEGAHADRTQADAPAREVAEVAFRRATLQRACIRLRGLRRGVTRDARQVTGDHVRDHLQELRSRDAQLAERIRRQGLGAGPRALGDYLPAIFSV